MTKPIIIIGAGGHAQVLLDILLQQKENIIGFTDKSIPKGTVFLGIPVLGDDSEIMHYSPSEVFLVNGVGSVGDNSIRTRIYTSFKEKGYSFCSVIHPTAVISSYAKLHEGVQVLAQSIIDTGAEVFENSIINVNTAINHNCIISAHCHVSSGVTLSGGVSVGEGSHIGVGSTVIQGIKIGKNSLVGAGSVVLWRVKDNTKVFGNPATEM